MCSKKNRILKEEVFPELWERVRTNAFAHEKAADEAALWNDWLYLGTIVFSLSSILFLLLAYVAYTFTGEISHGPLPQISSCSEPTMPSPQEGNYSPPVMEGCPQGRDVSQNDHFAGRGNVFGLVAITLVLSSIFCTFVALGLTIWNDRGRYGIISEQHKFAQISYFILARKVDEYNNPYLSESELQTLYDQVQNEFILTRARSIEPIDRHSKQATEVIRRIMEYKKEQAKARQEARANDEGQCFCYRRCLFCP